MSWQVTQRRRIPFLRGPSRGISERTDNDEKTPAATLVGSAKLRQVWRRQASSFRGRVCANIGYSATQPTPRVAPNARAEMSNASSRRRPTGACLQSSKAAEKCPNPKGRSRTLSLPFAEQTGPRLGEAIAGGTPAGLSASIACQAGRKRSGGRRGAGATQPQQEEKAYLNTRLCQYSPQHGAPWSRGAQCSTVRGRAWRQTDTRKPSPEGLALGASSNAARREAPCRLSCHYSPCSAIRALANLPAPFRSSLSRQLTQQDPKRFSRGAPRRFRLR